MILRFKSFTINSSHKIKYMMQQCSVWYSSMLSLSLTNRFGAFLLKFSWKYWIHWHRRMFGWLFLSKTLDLCTRIVQACIAKLSNPQSLAVPLAWYALFQWWLFQSPLKHLCFAITVHLFRKGGKWCLSLVAKEEQFNLAQDLSNIIDEESPIQ